MLQNVEHTFNFSFINIQHPPPFFKIKITLSLLCSADYRNVYTQRHVATYLFQIVVHSCLPTFNGYVQNRRRNVINELIFIRMRGRESGNITKFIGVNSFVKSLKIWYMN